MVKKFYIMRHGETFATKGNTGYGVFVFSAPILEEGKDAIKKQANFLKELKTDANYCSPVRRCLQTAQIVEDITDKKFVRDRALREFFLEPFWLFKGRIEKFLLKLDRNEDIESVLIVTHGAVIAGLTNLLMRDTFHIMQMTDYPKPGVMRIIERGKEMREIDFNIR